MEQYLAGMKLKESLLDEGIMDVIKTTTGKVKAAALKHPGIGAVISLAALAISLGALKSSSEVVFLKKLENGNVSTEDMIKRYKGRILKNLEAMVDDGEEVPTKLSNGQVKQAASFLSTFLKTNPSEACQSITKALQSDPEQMNNILKRIKR